MFGLRIMKVDREVGHDQQMTSFDFGVQRSRSQGPETVKSFPDDNSRMLGSRFMKLVMTSR